MPGLSKTNSANSALQNTVLQYTVNIQEGNQKYKDLSTSNNNTISSNKVQQNINTSDSKLLQNQVFSNIQKTQIEKNLNDQLNEKSTVVRQTKTSENSQRLNTSETTNSESKGMRILKNIGAVIGMIFLDATVKRRHS